MGVRKPIGRRLLWAGVLGCWLGAGAAAEEPEYEMTTYQFVMLKSGPDASPVADDEAEKIQRDHIAYLESLMDDGRALIAGPLADGGEIRGIVVLTVDSTEKAEAIFREDPWVRQGRLVAEIHPWWAAEGIIRKPERFTDLTSCHLGLLRRPVDAPEFDEAELGELQKGHMANIVAMADSGDLVIAGPMGDDGVLRGIFVFRTEERARVRELVARDPSIRAGRLEMELLKWRIPKGSLPPR